MSSADIFPFPVVGLSIIRRRTSNRFKRFLLLLLFSMLIT
jgi:hypothetical protein